MTLARGAEEDVARQAAEAEERRLAFLAANKDRLATKSFSRKAGPWVVPLGPPHPPRAGSRRSGSQPRLLLGPPPPPGGLFTASLRRMSSSLTNPLASAARAVAAMAPTPPTAPDSPVSDSAAGRRPPRRQRLAFDALDTDAGAQAAGASSHSTSRMGSASGAAPSDSSAFTAHNPLRTKRSPFYTPTPSGM